MEPTFWADKVVLITGVCGSVGSEVLKKLSEIHSIRIVGIDNSEAELFFLQREYVARGNIELLLGDVRDAGKMVRVGRGVDCIVHAAALKHFELGEQHPWEVALSNIAGTNNVIESALANDVERVMFTSSDKAVNPTSVMGASKLIGERLMSSQHLGRKKKHPAFSSVRFGNICGSSGSVIPLFKEQIASAGPVTITDRRMTRYVMSLSEAVGLILDSIEVARGGEVFIPKLPVLTIGLLAEVMIKVMAPKYGHRPEDIEVIEVGAKRHEKLCEEFIGADEYARVYRIGNRFFIAHDDRPGAECRPDCEKVSAAEFSPPAISRDELEDYLLSHGLLDV